VAPCNRRYNQQQDEEKEKLTALSCSSLFYVFTFARHVLSFLSPSPSSSVSKRRRRRRPGRKGNRISSAMHTLARFSDSNAGRLRVSAKRKRKERRRKKRAVRGRRRRVSVDDLREQIDSDVFAMHPHT
jgi:hypothetical protein